MASSGSETSNVDVEQLASWTCAATIVAQKAREKRRYQNRRQREKCNAMQTIDSRSPIQHFIIRKTAASTIKIHCQSKLLEWQGVYDKRMQTLQNRFASIHENIEA